MRKLRAVLLFTLSVNLYASDFDIEMQLLDKKLGLCESAQATQKCRGTGFCEDLSNYRDYLFKGSSASYMKYHIKNGNLNRANYEFSESVLKRNLSVLDTEIALKACK